MYAIFKSTRNKELRLRIPLPFTITIFIVHQTTDNNKDDLKTGISYISAYSAESATFKHP